MTSNLAFNRPRQERAQRSVERIVGAVEALLRDRPFEDISITEIIAKAKVSAGSFYARFSSKNAVLPYVYERYSAASGAAMQQMHSAIAWWELSLRARIEAALSLVTDAFLVKKWLMRAVVLFSRMRPGEVSADAAARSRRELDLGARALSANTSSASARRLQFAVYAMVSLGREHALFADAPLSKAMNLSRTEFETELADMVEAYLLRAGVEQQ